MDTKTLHIDLQSSCLAPLFADLQNPQIQEKDDSVVIQLKLQPAMPGDKNLDMLVIDNNGIVRFLVPGIAKSKEYVALARSGHVNHMTLIPKICWNPEDGEIVAEWSLIKDKGQTMTSELVEFVLANLLACAYREKVTLAVHLAKGNVPDMIITQMAEAAEKHLNETIMPCINEALSG